MFTKIPINCLTDNMVEILMVILIKWSFDNIVYENNPRHANFLAFLLMVKKGWLLDDEYIVYIVI